MPNSVPPHDLEAERYVLGAMLFDPEAADIAIDILNADDFYTTPHQVIFAAIAELVRRNGSGELDELLLRDELKVRGELSNVGGPPAIREITELMTSSALVEQHATRVKGHSRRRKAIQQAHGIIRAAHCAGVSIDEMHEKAVALEATLAPAEEVPSPEVPSPRKPFPVHLFPEPLRAYIESHAAALVVAPEYVAVHLLAAVAGVIGNTRSVQLKRTWIEPCIIWGAVVARSGTLKSPALDVAMNSVRALEARERRAHREAMREYDCAIDEWKRLDQDGPEPDRPIATRLIVADATVEAVAVIHVENARGLLMVRDELSGWLGAFDGYKQTRGADEAFWLEAFGAGSHTVDRKGGREALYIPRLSVSVAGTIQPGVLARMLGNAHFESGLAARLLLTMPEAPRKRWTEAEGDPNIDAAVEQLFEKLWALKSNEDQNGDILPESLPLTPAGKEEWIDFYNQWNKKSAGDDADAAAASKLEGYAARFALLFALVRNPDAQDVDKPDVEAGATLAWWFRDEALRVYDVLRALPDVREQNELVDWIKAHGGQTTTRQLQQNGPRRYRKSAKVADDALNLLESAGLGQWVTVKNPAGGPATKALKLYDSPATKLNICDSGDTATVATQLRSSVASPPKSGDETPDSENVVLGDAVVSPSPTSTVSSDGESAEDSPALPLDSDYPTKGLWSEDGTRWTREGYESIAEWSARDLDSEGEEEVGDGADPE